VRRQGFLRSGQSHAETKLGVSAECQREGLPCRDSLHKSHGNTPAAMLHDEKGGRSSHGKEVKDASICHSLVLIVIVTVNDRDPTPSSSEAFVIS
jgi:hypothetical protein